MSFAHRINLRESCPNATTNLRKVVLRIRMNEIQINLLLVWIKRHTREGGKIYDIFGSFKSSWGFRYTLH